MAKEFVVRNYRKSDRDSIRNIAYDTAFMGESADLFFDGREILADFLTIYFTDYEPQSCFVAEMDGDVIGYLLGARNEKRQNAAFIRIIPRLIIKAFLKGKPFRIKNMKFSFHIFLSALRGEFNLPDCTKLYPALLHINVDKKYRGIGIGRKLIETYVDYLKRENITGVHLITKSENAVNFFKKMGFEVFHKTSLSYLRYILKRNIELHILVKKI
ncbi:MAG: GNAT family N-acetyltransferase [Actinobacteria bacterium]|nr:GNAT family N-acetyltransferase [Actinomycetota bacterium]